MRKFLNPTTATVLAIALVATGVGSALVAADPAPPATPATLAIEFGGGDGKTLHLRGRDARQQLLVSTPQPDGSPRDATHAVTYKADPAGVVDVAGGFVTPLADGSATITATAPGGASATLPVTVENSQSDTPVNFPNQVVPIFTKYGCNGGGCHGKSGGQNGFKLSLLGFEPGEDYRYLVKEARGRRIFPAAPDQSLLLLKATGVLPHGGGKRFEVNSPDYNLIARWTGQGMPYGDPADPKVARIEVLPAHRTMALGGEQQMAVIAHYTDGRAEDVTRSAVYEANDKEMGQVDESGRLTVFQQPGDVSVMIRYQGQVAVFRATLPLGATVADADLPAAKNYVDELVFKKLKTVGMPPSPVCDDATFVRRVTLDIAGRPPTAEEAKAFLADADPAKRDKLIDRLLDSGEYADYFANKWSALLRNKRGNANHARGNYAFYAWVRDGLYANKPYDQFVREVLTATGDVAGNPAVAWYRQATTTQIQMEDTAQLFMGTRLQCAQCHHHPYEKWSQRDYHGFAAFFSQVGRKPSGRPGEESIFPKRGTAAATNPKTKENVLATGLGAAAPAELTPDDDARQALADWMTKPENPFFAKSLANRYWKHFFGRGLVDPEDDMRETNPPTNPELLDALAKDFVASKYDLKHLVRTICRSSTYQLSSEPNRYNAADKHNYSRYYPKRLQAEVLLDSVNQLTGSRNNFGGLPPGTRAIQLPDNSFNAGSYFLTVFGRPDASTACECERSGDASLAQSLHLFNSKDLQDKLTAGDGRAAKLAGEKDRPDEDKLRELYLWAYAREPDKEELDLAVKYLTRTVKDKEGKDVPADPRQAYEDVVWALINTKEFLFNH